MKRIRYGIMSVSSIAPRFIAAVREGDAGDIIAVSSRTLEKARSKADELGIPKAYGDYVSLLEDGDINTVYISSINSQHYAMAKSALNHGKNVVCEKPCTTSAEETMELYRLARKKGLFFMEAQKMLFLPAIKEVAEDIEGGKLGDVHMFEVSHSFSALYNDWMYNKEAGGGPLLSSGIYAVQLIQWLFGDIEDIGGVNSVMPNGVEWQYVITGKTKSGVLFSIKNSTQAILDNTARIYGTKGWVDIPEFWKAKKLIYHIAGEECETKEYPYKSEMVYEARHIAECMEKGLLNSPVVTEDISVKGIAALEKIKALWEK